MSKPVTISRSSATKLPNSWSNRGRDEYLHPDAYASLSRALNIAVADTGVNFQIWDALRDLDEQVAMLKQNYRRVSRGRSKSSDRTWDGSTWEKRPGRPNTASPGWSNHGSGRAIDIHPGPIQEWFKNKGRDHGWDWSEGRRNGENWHFTHSSSRDRYKSRGVLDHGAVQKVVGADVDGKIGTGTVKLIKAWQKKHGLEADGIVGPGTAKAMGLGKGEPAAGVIKTPAPKPAGKPKPSTAAESYKLDKDLSPNAYSDRKGHSVKHVTLHHWGRPTGQKRGGIIAWLTNPKANVSAHYVVTKGHVTQLVDESCGSWANGNKTANLESITIECDPNDPIGTLPTVAALIADIRGRHGDLPIYPHSHWVSTECPGAYRDLLPELDAMAKGGTANLGRPVVIEKPNVVVDGRFGHDTVRAFMKYLVKYHPDTTDLGKDGIDGKAGHDFWKSLQGALNTTVDGEVWDQSYRADELGNGITQGWKYTGRNSKGSKMVRAMQGWVGVEQDGVWFEGTSEALQRRLNTYEL